MQTFGISILAKELVAEAGSVIKEEDTRGKLPAPYDQKFVDEILEDGICVCGRPVEKDSREHERIKSLLETAGDQAVMSRVMTTNVMLGGLIEKERYAWRDHERNNEDLRKLEGEIRRLDADLLAISKELAENPISEIADKETARERAIAQRSQATERRVAAEVAIASFKREMAEQRNRLNQLTKESQAARRYVKRAHVAGALTAQLNERLRKEEESARAEIESEINSIIEEFMRKPALAKIDQDYQLRLFDEQGAELAKSTGENQLLGLAFTGAIAKYAKDRASVEDDILLPGTVAPLVVDSPFGHLDPTYRRGVAEFLPNLASQVILMVSTSQASEAVMTGPLAEKIGVEYVLTRHNRTDGAGKAPESIEIGGACYNLTTYNSEIVGTRVTEVRK